MRTHPTLLRQAMAAATLTLALSCRDTSPVSAPLTPGDVPQHMITELQVDPNDTWMSADISSTTTTTVYTDQPVTNTATGVTSNTVTTSTPTEVTHLAGGFDVSGQLQASIRSDLETDPSADPGAQVTTARIIGTSVVFSDGYGRTMPDYASNGTALPTLTASDLWMGDASMVDGTVVDDPAVLETQLKNPAVMSRAPTQGAMLDQIAAVSAAIRHRVERPDDATLVVVQEVDDDGTDAAMSRIAVPGAARDAATSSAGGHLTLTRTYRKGSEKQFVLAEIRAQREQSGPASHAVTVQTMTYDKVKWHKNRQKDEERAHKVKPASLLVPEVPRGPSAMIAIDDGGGGGYTPPPPPPPPTGPDYCSGSYYPERRSVLSGTGQHLVVQHGFSEDGCIYRYGRTRGDLEGSLRFDDDIMPTLDYGAPIASQSVALAGRVNAARGDGQSSIFIGYSNGGLVSRQLAQSNLSKVRGVVTVSTPNKGVPVVKLGYNAVASVLGPFAYFIPVTTVLGPIVRWLGLGGDGRPVPVLADVIAGGGSGYLDALNYNTEYFVRTGIVQRPAQRWLYRRVSGANKCSTANYTPCGRQAVVDMNNLYAHLKAQTVVHWTWNPFKLVARILKAAWAGAQMLGYNAIDGLFNLIIAPAIGDGSDGLVPFSSQRYRYPSTPDYEILSADSHAEAWASNLVTTQALRNVLTRPQYGVQPR